MTLRPVQQKPQKVKPDPEYLDKVRQLPCCGCGRYGPNEAHHCRDLPDFIERGTYQRLPGAARRSGDRDAIPLCQTCHNMFHLHRGYFHDLYGKDYGYIPLTRAMLSEADLDF